MAIIEWYIEISEREFFLARIVCLIEFFVSTTVFYLLGSVENFKWSKIAKVWPAIFRLGILKHLLEGVDLKLLF